MNNNMINTLKKSFSKFKYNIYKKSFLKLLKLSRKNFNIITYDQFFFLFKIIDLNDLKLILKISRMFNIKFYKNFPFKKLFLKLDNKNCNFYSDVNKNNKKYFFKNWYFNKIKNFKNLKDSYIIKSYKKIEKYINNMSKIFFSNIYIINDIVSYEIVFNNMKDKSFFFEPFSKSIIKKKPLNKNNKFFNLFFKKFNLNKNKKDQNIDLYNKVYKDENFNFKKKFDTFRILLKIVRKNKVKSNSVDCLYELLKKKNFIFDIKLDIIDELYKNFLYNFKEIEIIRNEIYDSLSNLSDITFLEFNFFFIKNGSNLKWMLNFADFSKFNSKKYLKKEFNKFINRKQKDIINFENKYFLPIKSLIKIFSVINYQKGKLDIIRRKIIKSKLNLVNSCTRKYINRDLYDEYLQEGNLALVKSVNNYNYKLLLNFNNFVKYRIKNQLNYFSNNNVKIIRIPNYIHSTVKKVNKYIKENFEDNFFEINIPKISKKINISENRIKKSLNIYYGNTFSIDHNINDEENESKLIDYISNPVNINFDDEIFNSELKVYLNDLINKNLDKRGIKILNLRYGLNFSERYTLSEIGGFYDISRERVRQIQRELLNKIKNSSEGNKLKNFFNNKNKYYYYREKK